MHICIQLGFPTHSYVELKARGEEYDPTHKLVCREGNTFVARTTQYIHIRPCVLDINTPECAVMKSPGKDVCSGRISHQCVLDRLRHI